MLVMNPRWTCLGVALLSALLGGCGSGESDAGDGAAAAAGDGTTDVRVQIPAADPAYIDLVGTEVIVPAGVEQLTCVHFRYDGDETAISDFESIQGKFGHHAILLGSKEPREPGSIEDCTDSKSMAKFDPYIIPVSLPAGHGVLLPKGKQLVLQTHYVNTSKTPIKTRDVVRIKRREPKDVTTWTAIFATGDTGLKLPARSAHTHTYTCEIPTDFGLLMLGGHMHERGKKISISFGDSPTTLKPVYDTEWQVSYRDTPPVNMMLENPMPLKKGTLIQTSCTWQNDSDTEVSFPSEMCGTFGYVAGVKDSVICHLGPQ